MKHIIDDIAQVFFINYTAFRLTHPYVLDLHLVRSAGQKLKS